MGFWPWYLFGDAYSSNHYEIIQFAKMVSHQGFTRCKAFRNPGMKVTRCTLIAYWKDLNYFILDFDLQGLIQASFWATNKLFGSESNILPYVIPDFQSLNFRHYDCNVFWNAKSKPVNDHVHTAQRLRHTNIVRLWWVLRRLWVSSTDGVFLLSIRVWPLSS